MSLNSLKIGIDVGGTFTDLVAVDEAGRVVTAKSPSTPVDQSIGVMTGLAELAQTLDITLPALLARTDRIVHGATVATNALIERKGARVALLTTDGHRDILEMREGLKDNRYDLRSPPPEPLVPRRLRFGVRERLRADGSVLIPLDLRSVDEAVAAIRDAGVDAVAVCYLHAYRDGAHERATRDRLLASLPDLFVSLSCEVLPQIKEYERVSTTVVNAYVGPPVRRYLTNLERRLEEAGFGGRLFIILSHGGMAPVADAARFAAGTVLSGPAGGVAAARRSAALLGIPDLVPFDMGGTSTDISLITGSEAALSSERGLAGLRIALRSLDIAPIGAGGGSIASLDGAGGLRIGPESAGASPGPACYGHGGEAATVTDANLILGFLDPDAFLGGRRRLDADAAGAALDRVASELGITREATASGIYRLVNLKMADGIRLMTTRRGVDPRRFALLSFGGAAGLHAAAVARELEIPRVIVPTVASVLSAWGMLATDLRSEASRTHIGDAAALTDAHLRAVFGDLEHQAVDRLGAWHRGAVRIERSAEMRYGEQIFEVEVPLAGLDWDGPNLLGAVYDLFHRRHEELYTYASRDQEVVLVNARVAAIGPVDSMARTPPGERSGRDNASRPRGRRPAQLDGTWRDVPVYAMSDLTTGSRLAGPALVEAETTTIVIGEGDEASVNELGWLDVRIRALNQARPGAAPVVPGTGMRAESSPAPDR